MFGNRLPKIIMSFSGSRNWINVDAAANKFVLVELFTKFLGDSQHDTKVYTLGESVLI